MTSFKSPHFQLLRIFAGAVLGLGLGTISQWCDHSVVIEKLSVRSIPV